MTLPQIVVILVLVIPLTLVFLNRLREDIAGLLMAALLGLAQFAGLGVLGPPNTPEAAGQALTGFGTPEVMTLLALFIITACLDNQGATRWMAKKILAIGGKSERRLIALFAFTGALLSLFMNTLAAGALLLPSALDAARRSAVKPSKLLIPIAYGTMLGGAATYLTTANIVVSGLLPLANPPQAPLGVLDFTPVGGVVMLTGLVFLTFFGKRLMPDREPPFVEIAHTSEEMGRTYQLQERLWEAEVTPNSELADKTLQETRIGETLGMSVLGVRRANRVLPVGGPGYTIHAGDALLVVGREERVLQLQEAGLHVRRPESNATVEAPGMIFVEMIVPPRSNLEGSSLRDVAFRANWGFTAVALWRDKRSYRTDVATFPMRTGDTLLLMGPREKLDTLKKNRDLVMVETAANGNHVDAPRLRLTLGISAAALIAMIAGVPAELATIAAVVLILITGLMKPDEAYSSIHWRAIFLIGGTISVSVAMVQTGLAALVGDSVVTWIAPFGAMGLVAGAYVLSAALTQVMGGQISPLVVAPITISAAIRLGVNPQAIAVVTAIAGSVSFITPLSHPVNILMIAPANYTFSDFIKSGWLLTIICFIALMIAVPLFWQL